MFGIHNAKSGNQHLTNFERILLMRIGNFFLEIRFELLGVEIELLELKDI